MGNIGATSSSCMVSGSLYRNILSWGPDEISRPLVIITFGHQQSTTGIKYDMERKRRYWPDILACLHGSHEMESIHSEKCDFLEAKDQVLNVSDNKTQWMFGMNETHPEEKCSNPWFPDWWSNWYHLWDFSRWNLINHLPCVRHRPRLKTVDMYTWFKNEV